LILGIGYGPSGDVGYSVDCGERAKLQALEKSDDVKRVLYEPSTPMGTLRFFVFIITHTHFVRFIMRCAGRKVSMQNLRYD